MQPGFLDWSLRPVFIPEPWALYPAQPSAPETVPQAATPAKKRPFSVDFLLSKSPSEVRIPSYPRAACALLPPGYPFLCQTTGHCCPCYSAWGPYCAGEGSRQPAVTHPNPARDRKSKRFRAIFTRDQLAVLEGEFGKQRYIVGPQRLALAAALGLTALQVKVWFQNRRIKWKKDAEKSQRVQKGKRASVEAEAPEQPAREQPSSGGHAGKHTRPTC